jgi:hypothetical protein
VTLIATIIFAGGLISTPDILVPRRPFRRRFAVCLIPFFLEEPIFSKIPGQRYRALNISECEKARIASTVLMKNLIFLMSPQVRERIPKCHERSRDKAKMAEQAEFIR